MNKCKREWLGTKPEKEVILSVLRYMIKEKLPYDLELVVHKSNHIKDDYLYMVVGKHKTNNTYAVWTCFNTTTNSMNFGHYGLNNEQEVVEVLDEYFHDYEQWVINFVSEVKTGETKGAVLDNENHLKVYAKGNGYTFVISNKEEEFAHGIISKPEEILNYIRITK